MQDRRSSVLCTSSKSGLAIGSVRSRRHASAAAGSRSRVASSSVAGELFELIADLGDPGLGRASPASRPARRSTPCAPCGRRGPRIRAPGEWRTHRGRRRVGRGDPNAARVRGCRAIPIVTPPTKSGTASGGKSAVDASEAERATPPRAIPGPRRGGVRRAAARGLSTARACMSGRDELAFGRARLDGQPNRDADACERRGTPSARGMRRTRRRPRSLRRSRCRRRGRRRRTASCRPCVWTCPVASVRIACMGTPLRRAIASAVSSKQLGERAR